MRTCSDQHPATTQYSLADSIVRVIIQIWALRRKSILYRTGTSFSLSTNFMALRFRLMSYANVSMIDLKVLDMLPEILARKWWRRCRWNQANRNAHRAPHRPSSSRGSRSGRIHFPTALPAPDIPRQAFNQIPHQIQSNFNKLPSI